MKIFKKPNAPQALEILAKSRERRENLSQLRPIVEEGEKLCVWCLDQIPPGCRKYCSTFCSESAWAFFNPQSKVGLRYLLVYQNFTCNKCGFDYKPFIEMITGSEVTQKSMSESGYGIYGLSNLLRKEGYEDHVPEVDHIEAIALGGESLGFDNHQVLCKTCHKEKTADDMRSIRG